MSQNIDGALAFKATLDIDDFNVSAEAMERRIRDFSLASVYESERMEQSILSFAQNGAKYIVSYLVGQGMMGLVNSIVQTRGEFQQLQIAFETMLGSGTKSQELMNQMIETAAKTPFDLKGVAMGAKSLLAYGFAADEVNDTLIRLGNIASGLSIPLNDMVYLYGTTMTQGRLYAQDMRQFMGRGIPLAKELAEMYGKTTDEINAMVSAGKIGFADVEKVMLKMTNEGGQFYNLMEKQSSSLTGMIANLADAWDMALNQIGEANQDTFASGIEGATYLVENLDTILNIVKAITIAYGSYKAAVVVNTLATKGYTGVALIDNTVRQAKMALMKADAALTGESAAQTAKMTAAQIAHTKALEAQLTAQEKANMLNQLRIATIEQLLTAQQHEYISNLGLTTSSANYEEVAIGVMSVEQKQALSKIDLTSKSAIYRTALEREVLAKQQQKAATIDAMREDVKAAHAKMEAAKQQAVISIQAVEMARYELYWAKQSGDATRIAVAEKKLEGAIENQAIARKAALGASTDFFTKKKTLEAAVTKKTATATTIDTTAKTAATTSTNLLTAATGKLTLAVRTLWASMKANPIGWVLTGIGMLISAFSLFKSKQNEATDGMSEFQDTTRKEIDNLNMLVSILKTTESGTKAHKNALDKVNAILQEYNKELLTEKSNLDDLNTKYKELTKAINESAAARIKAKYIEQYQSEYSDNIADATKKLRKRGSKLSGYEYVEATGSGYYYSIESIRKMNESIYDMIELMAVESADKLKGLTGDAYTKAFKETINNISESVKSASGASDQDIQVFSTHISQYLSTIIENTKELDDSTLSLTKSMDEFISVGGKPAVADSIDYTSMSLSELDKIAIETQKEIDNINNKTVIVETDNTKLYELIGILNQVNNAISGKEANLNTESGINARIKELKEERADVEINSAKYKELTKTINTLQGKLPSTGTGSRRTGSRGRTKNTAEQIAEKQIQSELRLEKARIEIMEDGHEKRKAILNLQHKQNLLAIDKEEKELIKARKEAGKGKLTADEAATFKSRRDIENKAYLKAQNTLFDDEISYKKQQYELYWRWVENIGESVANERFSSLLKNGESYKAYLESQIAILEKKQKSDSITDGEGNFLISLKSQLDEINGVKSAMDRFKESMTATISEASTLADKIKIVSDFKAKLEKGELGLVGADQMAAAALFISEQETENQKKIQERLTNDFKTFEQKKNDIIEEYKLLRIQKQVQGNKQLLNMINKGEADALSAVQAQILMQSDSWTNLFSDLDNLTVSAIDALITEIEKKMKSADLKLNPADMKAVLDQLDIAKRKMIDTNPFQAMGIAIKRIFIDSANSAKKSSAEIKRDWNNLAKSTEGAFMFINNAISSTDFLKEVLGDAGTTAIGVLQGVTMAGVAMATAIKTAEKGSVILAAISATLTVVNALFAIFNKDKKKEKNIKSLQKEVDALSKSYNDLSKEIDRAYGFDKAKLIEEQNKNLEEQNKKIHEQIRNEESKKKKEQDRIDSWYDKIEENEAEIAENRKYRTIESILGTDIKSAIDQFADAYADAWAKGEEAAGKSADVVKNLIKTQIIATLKSKLKPEVEAFMTFMANALKDGVIDDAEQRMIDEWEKKLDDMTDMELRGKEKWLRNDDTDNDDKSIDPLTGAIRGMSEETGSIIAGKFNAFVINQSEQTNTLRQSLIYQIETANNTKVSASELRDIKQTLIRIENKDNSLLSQGIGG